MKKWGRRIRGAIGMGLTWGAAWFGAGILLARVPGFFSDVPFDPICSARLSHRRHVLRHPRGHRGSSQLWSHVAFALRGMGRGEWPSALRDFVVGAALRGASVLAEFLVFGPALAMASAVCAAGSLAMARRAERRELRGPSGDLAEAELTEDEKPELLGRGD